MNEPTLEEIWTVRQETFAECDNDPYKLVAYYLQQQATMESASKVELVEA